MSKIPRNVNHKPWLSDLMYSRCVNKQRQKTKIIFVPRPKKDSNEHTNDHVNDHVNENENERSKLKIELTQRNDLVNNSLTPHSNEHTQTDSKVVRDTLTNSSTSTQTLIPGYMIRTPVAKSNKKLLGLRK